MDSYDVIYLITNFVLIFTIERFIGIFFLERRTSFIITALSYLLYFVATSLAFFTLGIPVINTMTVFATIFIITLCYKATTLKRLAATACACLFLFMVDMLTYVIFSGEVVASYLTPVGELPDMGLVVTGILGFLLAALLRRFKHIRKYDKPEHHFWITSLFIPVTAIYVTILVVTTADLTLFASITIVVAMFGVSLLTFYLLDAISASYEDKLKFQKLAVEAKYEVQRKEDEQKALQFYTTEIEHQYMVVRKYQHDYQNILSSLYAFIEEGDMEKLKEYYMQNIAKTSEDIKRDKFALEALSKINVTEIKGILAAKLMKAQSLGIDTTFEAKDEINAVYMDSVALVRMLGIIMDNAIEELEQIKAGKLLVGCYKLGDGITFVIQNTCRPDTPEIYMLEKEGFSTKGEGRGLGLSNLSELVGLFENVALFTSIEDGNFIQKLRIEKDAMN